MQLNFSPFPIFETERFVLRQFKEEDANDLLVLRSDARVMQYICKPLAKSIQEMVSLIQNFNAGVIENNRIIWAIEWKETKTIVGTISYHDIDKENFRGEIGYMLHPDLWNKGILSEVLTIVIPYAFNEMKLHSIEAKIDPDNIYSKKLLLKNNFVKEAYFKGNFFFNEQFLDTEVYSLLNNK